MLPQSIAGDWRTGPLIENLDDDLIGCCLGRLHCHIANSLHSAAGELEQLGRASEAVGLYREVVSEYADVAVAAEANGRLQALTGPAAK